MPTKPLFLAFVFLTLTSTGFAHQVTESESSGNQAVQSTVAEPQDPIADELDAAKFQYVSEIAAAYEKFVEEIDAEITATENNTKLSVESQLKKLNDLKADRLSVMNGTNKKLLHKSSQTASRKYKKQVAASKKLLEKAFVRAADQYRKPPLKNFAAAAQTLDDQKKFFEGSDESRLGSIPTFVLPRSGWTIEHVDCATTKRPASSVLDGDSKTFWITVWNASPQPNHPHEIDINLGKPTTFIGFQYTAVPGGSKGAGRVREYEIYASDDGKSWGRPLASGEFKDIKEPQDVVFKETTARYVRLVTLSAYRNSSLAAISELNLLSSKPATTSTFVLSQEDWTIEHVDSAANNRPGSNVIDGNPKTHWITVWDASRVPKHPHEIQINLGGPRTFSRLRYTARQGNQWIAVGRLNEYEIYASDDGKSWGKPLASGTFKDTMEPQDVAFGETTARYVRLVSLSSYRESEIASIAELNLLNSGPQATKPSDSFFESKE